MVELVAVNKMGVPNIAMIFGPTLMSNENVSTGLVFLGASNLGMDHYLFVRWGGAENKNVQGTPWGKINPVLFTIQVLFFDVKTFLHKL